MAKLAEYTTRVKAAIQDAANKLADSDRDLFIRQAIVQRYSKDAPREMVSDVAGNGTSLLPLPTSDGGPAFEEGFSIIRQIEYPIGEVPPSLIEGDEWMLYRSPQGMQIYLQTWSPAGDESLRLTWTARHSADGSTVPESDFEAVCDYAASLCFEALAAIYAQSGGSTFQADTVDYRGKGSEYLTLAKAARKRYFAHLGIPDDSSAAQGGSAAPGIAMGDMDMTMGWGGDRITHSRRTR